MFDDMLNKAKNLILKRNTWGFVIDERGSSNPNDIAREVFNPYDESLMFYSTRPHERKLWVERECLPGHARFLPHGDYICLFKCGFRGWAKSPFGGLNPQRRGCYIDVPTFFGDTYHGLKDTIEVTTNLEALRSRYKHVCL